MTECCTTHVLKPLRRHGRRALSVWWTVRPVKKLGRKGSEEVLWVNVTRTIFRLSLPFSFLKHPHVAAASGRNGIYRKSNDETRRWRRRWPLVNSVCLCHAPISKLLQAESLFIVRPYNYLRVTERLDCEKSTRAPDNCFKLLFFAFV